MSILIIQNIITGERFEECFDSEYLKEKYKNKCKYSKRIRVIGEIKY